MLPSGYGAPSIDEPACLVPGQGVPTDVACHIVIVSENALLGAVSSSFCRTKKGDPAS